MKNVKYVQATGALFAVATPDDKKGTRLGAGYSGHPPYVNDPDAEALASRGPIPRGTYRAIGPFDHNTLGPMVWFLAPDPANRMQGRSGFFIHGDNAFGNRSASHGCIVLPRLVRAKLADLGAFRLEVA